MRIFRTFDLDAANDDTHCPECDVDDCDESCDPSEHGLCYVHWEAGKYA